MHSNWLVLLAEQDGLIDEGIRFKNLPPNYVAWLLIPLAIIAFAWFFYKREDTAPRGVRLTAAVLRILAIFFICLLLFEPYRHFLEIDEVRSVVTVVVDESASMEKKDGYDQDPELANKVRRAVDLDSSTSLRSLSRTELVQRALGPDGTNLIEKLAEKHDVKIVGGGSKVRPIEELSGLRADGPVTALGDTLARVIADPDIQAKPNASIVLISDGRNNTGANPVDVARHAGENEKIPIHTIGVGDPNAMRDIELRFIRADEVALKGNTLKMRLIVKNRGYPQDWIKVTVIDQKKRPWIAPQRKKLKDTEADQEFEIDLVAARVGQFALDVRILGPSGEENTRNNAKTHVLTVKDDKIKVLYVDTLPRWEYRKLKNFLIRGDQSFVTKCLLLSAEPSFPQETTVGTEKLEEFPATFEELDLFDVLVFGDVDPNLLVSTPDKLATVMKNIQQFVDAGGGIAIIAGEGWTPRAYVDTPLEELMPVDVTNSGEFGPQAAYVDEWKPHLSAIGRAHSITQLEKDANRNRRLWEDRGVGLATLRWWYPVRKSMPAAQVLAYHPDRRNQFGYYPLFVTGVYGDGPVFFSAVDETWRWFHTHGAIYFNRFWGNVVRYLARSHLYRGSKRFKLVSNASEYQLGENVYLTAFVRDRNFQDSTTPTQKVMVVAPNSKGRAVEFENIGPGEYAWSFKPTKNGRYEAWVVGAEGVAGKRYAPISFQVRFIDPETQETAMNEALLKDMAGAAGGSYFRLDQADGLFGRLQADTTQRRDVTSRPLRARNWLPIVFLLLLTAEWLIRRRYRME